MKRNLESRVEVVAPVEKPVLREALRQILEVQLNDRRSAWEMQSDGTYVQRRPEKGQNESGAQEILIELADKRSREAGQGKKRKRRKKRLAEVRSDR